MSVDILLCDGTIWASHQTRVDVTENRLFGRYWIVWRGLDGLHHGTWRNTKWSAVRKAKRVQRRVDRVAARAKSRRPVERWEPR